LKSKISNGISAMFVMTVSMVMDMYVDMSCILMSSSDQTLLFSIGIRRLWFYHR
jgi:hypothetical protein